MIQWFLKKKKKKKQLVTDNEIEHAKKIIDSVIYPQIKKHIKILNEYLEDRNLQVGIEINWFFDKIE